MAAVPDRVYGPAQPGTSTAVLATVPASTRWTIRSIVICNTTGTAATLTLGIGGTAVGDRLLSAISVPANDTLIVEPWTQLDAAETIDGLQGTSGALTVSISVVSETV